MSGIKNLSGQELIKLLSKAGFVVKRQKGSHVILIKEKGKVGCTVPLHKELKIGTIKGVLKQAGISTEDFVRLLKKGN